MKFILVLAALLPLEIQASDKESFLIEEGLNVIQIYDPLVTSNAAAGKFTKLQAEEVKSFLLNFQEVTLRAAKELELRSPDQSSEQRASLMKKRGQLITQNVFDIVEERGCEDEDIKKIVLRLYVQARWKMPPN